MKSYPRDWIAWMVAAAIVVVIAVELISAATATPTTRLAEDSWARLRSASSAWQAG